MTAKNQMEFLMAPKKIAIVGASVREDAIGTRIEKNLQDMGFAGEVFLVNPKYKQLRGQSCYASLQNLPEQVDAAFLAVPAEAAVKLTQEASSLGIPAVLINANGFAEGGQTGIERQSRLSQIAHENATLVCGPNNIGFINFHDKVALWTPRFKRKFNKGRVSVITQSGSVAIAISENERDLGFSYIITAGNEAVLDVSDYLDFIADDPNTDLILLYLETLRDPIAFRQAAEKAKANGKIIIVLKVGTSSIGKNLVMAHTGGVAGDDDLYDEYFYDIGVIRVNDLDQLIEAGVLFTTYTKFGLGSIKGVAAVTLSGGEAALIADLADPLGVPFANLGEQTLAAMRKAYPSHSVIGNPVDAWGLGFNKENFDIIIQSLAHDPNLSHILICVDAPASGGVDVRYTLDMAEVASKYKDKVQFIFVNN